MTFKQAVVRDLAWVMLSPGLLDSSNDGAHLVTDEWCQRTYAEHLESLHRLDENPQPLRDYLADLKSHRLGFYFEMLLAFWLEHILCSNPFNKNTPVFQEKKNAGRRTIGEFDFLFGQNNQPMLSHWEVTVKFYLCHESGKGDIRWLGPAGQDRFDIKLSRIFEHQLKLAETIEGRSAIDHFSLLPVNAEAFIKGYLFYPAIWGEAGSVDARESILYSDFEVSSQHLRGWWLRLGETVFPKRFVDSRWLVLPKPKWLSAAWCASEEGEKLLDDGGIEKYCTHHFAMVVHPYYWQKFSGGLMAGLKCRAAL